MNQTFFQNKKGFTLVELMIVVVIMGILVAVAVPVYGAVTTNAERKTCHANCRIIQEMAVNCRMIDIESSQYSAILKGNTTVTIANQTEAQAKLHTSFLANFDDSQFPVCPTGAQYQITVADGDPGEFRVVCSEHGDKEGNSRLKSANSEA